MSNHGQLIPFTPKNYKKNEQEKGDLLASGKKEEDIKNNEAKNNQEKQQMPTPLFISPLTPIPNSFFVNQVQTNKNYYNKFQTKKNKYFIGRTGDWFCNNCKNLNFAFRTVCNRCKLPKPNESEKKETNDEKANNLKNYDLNNKHHFQNKAKFKYKKNYQYYNESKTNSIKKEEEK